MWNSYRMNWYCTGKMGVIRLITKLFTYIATYSELLEKSLLKLLLPKWRGETNTCTGLGWNETSFMFFSERKKNNTEIRKRMRVNNRFSLFLESCHWATQHYRLTFSTPSKDLENPTLWFSSLSRPCFFSLAAVFQWCPPLLHLFQCRASFHSSHYYVVGIHNT